MTKPQNALLFVIIYSLLFLSLCHETSYYSDLEASTADPSVSLVYYNRQLSSNALKGKGGLGLCDQVAVSSPLGYSVKVLINGQTLYDSIEHKKTVTSLTSVSSRIGLLESSSLYCAVWENTEGLTVPVSGIIEV
eukprot:c18762_g1_i2.p1 GENE.c18762_g1_i2~~c18762_g1_i2.p1  ORF type:complete len:158 (-),score=45.40 c18762_g1_i2:25-429(-)